MIYKISAIKKDNYLVLVLLHIAIGFVIYFYEPIASLYFYFLLVYFMGRIIVLPAHKKTHEILLGCAYFAGAEVFFRMTKSGLAYESSKYLVIVFIIMGMFFKGISGKGYPYFFYLIAMVPAVLVASITLSFDANFRTNVAFVLSGPVCLGVAALFCYDRKVSSSQLLEIIMYLGLPVIAMTTYIFLYNPSIKDALSGTASNAAASGGFGPNQVSTALGLGMIALVVRFFLKSPTLFLKLINVSILGAMTFRAIVTFSRGGVIAAIIVIVAFLFTLFLRGNTNQKGQLLGSMALFVVAVMVTWTISSNQTYGLIDKRYANEDALGRDKEDITTGRLDLFQEELDGFLSSPFLGLGASRIKDIRVEESGRQLPSHNEIGRLLSEHGFLGILIILILVLKPLIYRANNKGNICFFAFFCFWFATINHSAMRIAAPAFIYALCLLNVTNEKTVIHRQQIKK